MSETNTLAASVRDRGGKGAARAARREGRVPAVIYGGKTDPIAISIEERALNKLLHQGGFFSTMLEIDADGQTESVLPRDVQFHPVTDRAMHVDFLRLAKDATIAVEIPVHFTNEDSSPGLKRGGVLNIVRHTVEVNAPATAIPDAIEIDVSAYDIGDSIHISAVALPDGVEPTITDRDFTIATIAAPSAVKSAEGEEGDEAEDADGGDDAAEEEGGED